LGTIGNKFITVGNTVEDVFDPTLTFKIYMFFKLILAFFFYLINIFCIFRSLDVINLKNKLINSFFVIALLGYLGVIGSSIFSIFTHDWAYAQSILVENILNTFAYLVLYRIYRTENNFVNTIS